MKIEKLLYRGDGLGHDGGKAVFVPFTVPGETVSWRPIREKKRYIRGELIEILTPSPDRVAPRCPEFGRCGGCQWQHLAYPAQLRWKRAIVEETLKRMASISPDRVAAAIASPSPWGYRTRARLAWDRDGIGFFRSRSHRLVPLTHCPLLDPRLNEALRALGPFLAASQGRGREVLLETGDGGAVRCVLRFRAPGKERKIPPLKEAVSLADRMGIALWVDGGNGNPVRLVTGGGDLAIQPLDAASLRLAVPPGGFVQGNLMQNRRLVGEVIRLLEGEGVSLKGKRVLDLYCGMGNLSLPLAARGALVTGVDHVPSSIEMAKRNAEANRLSTSEFICADAGRFLRENLGRKKPSDNDILILDPPRTGAREAAEILSASEKRPEVIIYVSCDPMTLARDLKIMSGAYEVRSVTPLDMFPQTFHVETVTVLARW